MVWIYKYSIYRVYIKGCEAGVDRGRANQWSYFQSDWNGLKHWKGFKHTSLENVFLPVLKVLVNFWNKKKKNLKGNTINEKNIMGMDLYYISFFLHLNGGIFFHLTISFSSNFCSENGSHSCLEMCRVPQDPTGTSLPILTLCQAAPTPDIDTLQITLNSLYSVNP